MRFVVSLGSSKPQARDLAIFAIPAATDTPRKQKPVGPPAESPQSGEKVTKGGANPKLPTAVNGYIMLGSLQ